MCRAGLGWDVNKYSGTADFDLDAEAFLLKENGKVRNDGDFIFYNNLIDTVGAVKHMGDNLTGAGDGDDEQIKVDLSRVPADITKIAFTVTIHDATARHQNFGLVSNAFIRIVDEDTQREILRYDLSESYSVETALVVGELYRNGSEWKFAAIGMGYHGDGLGAIAKDYGVNV